MATNEWSKVSTKPSSNETSYVDGNGQSKTIFNTGRTAKTTIQEISEQNPHGIYNNNAQILKQSSTANRSELDAVSKATASPAFSSDLEALSRGNISLFGNALTPSSGRSSETPSNIAKSTSRSLLTGGQSEGSFNKAGQSVTTPTLAEGAAGALVKLAKPVFTLGSTAEAVAVDIYGDTLNSPQNRIKSILGDVLDIANNSLLGSLSSTLKKATSKLGINGLNLKGAEDVLGQFKSNILAGVPLNKEGMAKSLQSAIGWDGKSDIFTGGIDNLAKSMLQEITQNIDGQTGLFTIYDDVRMVLKGDFDTAAGMFKILDNFTSNSTFAGLVDLTNQFKIINTVTKSLMNLGAPKLFDKIIEKIDRKDRDAYFRENIQTALMQGDLDFIAVTVRHLGGPWVMSNYPDALSRIATSYTPIKDADDQVPSSEYVKLMNVLESLDMDWDVVGMRHGVKVYSTELFSKFNDQAKLAFLAGGHREHITALLISEAYKVQFDTLHELQLRHPMFPIK